MFREIGIDTVYVPRIKKILLKWDDRFLDRYFTDGEKKYIYKNNIKAETVAGIFGGKEAISKLLGTGIRNMVLKDVEILHDSLGRPYGKLYGNAKELGKGLGITSIKLSISHDGDYVVVVAIGIGESQLLLDPEFKRLLPKRKDFSHKGTYGRVGVVAGSKGMTGSNYLASMSSLRSGTGISYSIVPDEIADLMNIKFIEPIVIALRDKNGAFCRDSFLDLEPELAKFDSLVIGPGMRVSEDVEGFIRLILEAYEGPVVLDADGLNNLGQSLDRGSSSLVITPHPLEFSRLTGVNLKDIEGNREFYARDYAEKNKLVLVLKGHNTVVTDGRRTYINRTGNSGMSTAGSGDVLSGIIGSFLGQGIDDFTSAKLGVYVHGLAGDLAREKLGEYGMTAMDILNELPQALRLLSL